MKDKYIDKSEYNQFTNQFNNFKNSLAENNDHIYKDYKNQFRNIEEQINSIKLSHFDKSSE